MGLHNSLSLAKRCPYVIRNFNYENWYSCVSYEFSCIILLWNKCYFRYHLMHVYGLINNVYQLRKWLENALSEKLIYFSSSNWVEKVLGKLSLQEVGYMGLSITIGAMCKVSVVGWFSWFHHQYWLLEVVFSRFVFM